MYIHNIGRGLQSLNVVHNKATYVKNRLLPSILLKTSTYSIEYPSSMRKRDSGQDWRKINTRCNTLIPKIRQELYIHGYCHLQSIALMHLYTDFNDVTISVSRPKTHFSEYGLVTVSHSIACWLYQRNV